MRPWLGTTFGRLLIALLILGGLTMATGQALACEWNLSAPSPCAATQPMAVGDILHGHHDQSCCKVRIPARDCAFAAVVPSSVSKSGTISTATPTIADTRLPQSGIWAAPNAVSISPFPEPSFATPIYLRTERLRL